MNFTNKPIKAAKSAVLRMMRHLFFVCAKPLPIDQEQGPILVIAPHPDDETLGCGATILRARQAGRKIHVIVVTDGSASSQSAIITPQELATLRQKETEQACSILGLSPADIVFLPFPDTKAGEHVHEIAVVLQKHIQQIKPQTIFSPYFVDGNPDHIAVAAAIDELFTKRTLAAQVYEYPIWFWPWGAIDNLLKPWRMKGLKRVSTAGLLERKEAALQAYKSQCVNLTGEKEWWVINEKDLKHFFLPYEIFFEKSR